MLAHSSVDFESLIAEFKSQTLSRVAWTHEAHLCVGLWFVKRYSYEDAVCRLRSGIILLNDAHGTENTENSGYHETLTIFWTKVISLYIEVKADLSVEELPKHFLTSRLAQRSFPFDFYEREKLLSSKYRSVYVKEELKSLDVAAISAYLQKQ